MNHAHKNSPLKLRFVPVVLVAFTVLVTTTRASALEFDFGSPFGDVPQDVFLGTNTLQLSVFPPIVLAPFQFALFRRRSDSVCKAVSLTGNVAGGLSTDVAYLGQASSDNVIIVRQTETVSCNSSNGKPSQVVLSPLNYNGHVVGVSSAAGNDVVSGNNGGNQLFVGGDGNDVIIAATSNFGTIAAGGNGNDLFISDAGNAIFSGNDGNDAFCLEAAVVGVDGGNGTDTICGSAQQAVSIESLSCAPCDAPQ